MAATIPIIRNVTINNQTISRSPGGDMFYKDELIREIEKYVKVDENLKKDINSLMVTEFDFNKVSLTYNNLPVYHLSRGYAAKQMSTTLFFTHPTENKIEIIAIGLHETGNEYRVIWRVNNTSIPQKITI